MASLSETEQKMHILLVDDQPEGLLALEAVLQDLDQHLLKARSGREALRHLMTDKEFAVILLDIQMPEMDGYETAALIRERESCRLTPIVFLTASHTADVQMMRGYALGAVDYIFKPLDAAVLRSKVCVFVELARKAHLITRQKDALLASEQEARRLAEERAGLLAALQQQNLELAAVNQELEAFSYSVSHDLRSPLRSIDGFSQLLLDDYADRLDESGMMHLRRVRAAAQHMGELIEGMLSLARVTRQGLQHEHVDLTRLAWEVIARIQAQPDAGERRVEFVVAEKLSAEGDPRLLGIVFDNLINNAWKFTGKRSDARIEIGCSLQAARAPQAALPTFFVRDNGAGFDMAHSAKLFGTFQRLHRSTDFEGNGIGLATVQRIVRRHGGRIWAEGEVGVGATFHFTLAEPADPATSSWPPR